MARQSPAPLCPAEENLMHQDRRRWVEQQPGKADPLQIAGTEDLAQFGFRIQLRHEEFKANMAKGLG